MKSRRVFNHLTIPKLYAAITVEAKDESALEDVDVEPFLRTCSKPKNCLRSVKNLHIVARFHRNLKDRCVHEKLNDGGMELDDSEVEPLGRIQDLAHNLMPLFCQLEDNSLRSFR